MKEIVPYIQVENIVKTFGKVIANKKVNLTVYGGEIHSLLGENGAGKSTLMNMLSGVYTPDSGSIYIHGEKVNFSSPKDAINSGIGMIYQHFKLVDNMTGEENITIGQKNTLFINKKKIRDKIYDICNRYEIDVDLKKKVFNMSVGEKQIVEMIKVLYRGADILILDEPTTVFTPQEAEKLFNIMFKMRENGCAIIFISHKMDEVMKVSDKITILRKGETIKTLNKDETNPEKLAELMVGQQVDLSIRKSTVKKGEEILRVNDLTVKNEESVEVLKKINFNIHRGEVLGIAGIAGSGQKEICEAITGIQAVEEGEIILQGENIVGKTPREIIKKGVSMSFVPEDRLGMGLVGAMDMVDNLLLKSYHNMKGIILNKKPIAKRAKEIKEDLSIVTPDINYPIKNLSGGNIQKILLGRELDSNPNLLIMAYPVRGLDINTCYTIYNLIDEQKQKGVAVLYIGEDLDVLMQLSDRILVICDGKITGELNSSEATKEKIGLLMGGKSLEREESKVV
ncbi:simple sugar transport system ATP-binding protein [Clostridium tetanomorphum]|uniref:ABC transporter ATP-binding protein n=1 Tax=Clostridium tetanomorphum TaxID=1553 RepID=A0A923EB61_CLOTT|nr:ABC transporter ATP-binding protein [Clostridium tetanomorphum]KAJ48965.1 ABC transporter ATP-binding protein [Clostridium tetanomorphum DSM 665]KAJ51324.1 ABC transporter ATP-binding protein [Clostridium tetanomorphum DSM 665]MBC2399825.1 ABC transporter ATP-binding protein [Clostridium tetanomorphum]MBP1865989.1 simple sugar transport system ATP-binding protein [Clostridium tetanomorphum]NRS85957.1 simple sugar transport system ATP-binding protein [Clostridium tetanomorphum]